MLKYDVNDGHVDKTFAVLQITYISLASVLPILGYFSIQKISIIPIFNMLLACF